MNVENVEDMSKLCLVMEQIFQSRYREFNVENVEDMSAMFNGATNFNHDNINRWNIF